MPLQTGGEESMSDEKRLIGEVKRDGTLLYELTTVDGPHGRKAEANRWEAGVGSVMRACSMAQREQIAERLKVAANAFEPLVAYASAEQELADFIVQSRGEDPVARGHTMCALFAKTVALRSAALRSAGVEPKP